MNAPRHRQIFGFFQTLSPVSAAVYGLAFWAVFFVAWELAVRSGAVNELLLPRPHKVVTAIYNLIVNRGFAYDIMVSVLRVVVSFSAACAIAVPLGILMGTFKRVEATVNPFVSAWRYLPAPAFVPILLMWFGTDEAPKLALLFIGVVFFLITLVMDHTHNVRRELIETSMSLGGSRWQVLSTVVVPAAMPGILVALRQMLAISWTYLVVAEIVASTTGIGAMMMTARRFLRTEEIMAGIVVIGILGLCFDLLFRALHRFLFPYMERR